jgi:hypothetical protein
MYKRAATPQPVVSRVTMRKLLLAAAAAVISGSIAAFAANLAPIVGTDLPAVQNAVNTTLIPAINAGITNQSMAGWQPFRNYLHNGEHLVSQRGTAAVTGGTTSGCAVASYVSDRWCVDTNVSSGAGQGQVITASPAPPPGFTQSVKIWRNSGALTQQVCALQELKTSDVVALQGQSVIFSMYAQPLAALSSASGAVQAYLLIGTGTDQGLGALRSAVGMTASPAITPAWTGIGGGTTPMVVAAASPTWNLGTTAAWSRLYTAPTPVPITTTEAGIAICFTPVGSSSGATDGFAFTGAQLEVAGANSIVPSSYEHVTSQAELARDLRFYWQVNETNGTIFWTGQCTATNVDSIGVQLPVQMDIVPVVAYTAGGFQLVIAGAAAAGISGQTTVAGNVNLASLKFTNTCVAGNGVSLIGSNTTGNINMSADF